jgi:hypothetical protein
MSRLTRARLRAFNAERPAFVPRLMKECGDEEVKYGEVVGQGATGVQGLAIMEQPRFRGLRLELADPNRVIPLKAQEKYI